MHVSSLSPATHSLLSSNCREYGDQSWTNRVARTLVPGLSPPVTGYALSRVPKYQLLLVDSNHIINN